MTKYDANYISTYEPESVTMLHKNTINHTSIVFLTSWESTTKPNSCGFYFTTIKIMSKILIAKNKIKLPKQHNYVIKFNAIKVDTNIHYCRWRSIKSDLGYQPNVLEVFMLQSTLSCNSSNGIQAKHFLE